MVVEYMPAAPAISRLKRRRRPADHPLCLLGLLLISSLAWAGDIHKCTDASGNVSYSDTPCTAAEKSAAIRSVPIPTTASEQKAAPIISNSQRADCAAAAKAMREKPVPVDELEKLKIRIGQCVQLEYLEAVSEAQVAAAAVAARRPAEIARMSAECQALNKEISDLQTKIETPDEINHYIDRTTIYERKCGK